MAISEAFELDGVTPSGTTELSIPRNATYDVAQNQATSGVYQLWVDAGNMLKADEYRIRIYEKVEATGGTSKVVFEASLLGLQAQIFVTPTLVLMHGWDMTLKKIAGTDRAFDCSIRRIS